MRRHGEQFAAYRADARIELAGVHQRLDKVGQQQKHQGFRVRTQSPLESLMA